MNPLQVLPLWASLALPGPAGDAPQPGGQGDPALAQYAGAFDRQFAWREVSRGRIGRTDYLELILRSQAWRGIVWKHQLVVMRPPGLEPGRSDALLFVHGGRWRDEFESGWSGPAPASMRLFARLAETAGAPVAVLRQVPFQPLFGLREDALIAHTFDRFLVTGDGSWPLLLPMVKSVVRGMDAVQQVAAARWDLEIGNFTVAGASKRGWTTWLTAAVDPRVMAIAPMVIDMLDIPAQIDLQRARFGSLSEQVQDYADIGLPERLDSPRGQRLLDIVDPYRHRERIRQPKLIVLGTNDPYWPVDALNVYWDGLAAPRRALYFPNQGHSLKDYSRLIAALASLHRHAARGEALPALDWQFDAVPGEISLRLRTDEPPARVRLWTAAADSADLREARWRARNCRRDGEAWSCHRRVDAALWSAAFAEVTWRHQGEPELVLTTTVQLKPPQGEADRR